MSQKIESRTAETEPQPEKAAMLPRQRRLVQYGDYRETADAHLHPNDRPPECASKQRKIDARATRVENQDRPTFKRSRFADSGAGPQRRCVLPMQRVGLFPLPVSSPWLSSGAPLVAL